MAWKPLRVRMINIETDVQSFGQHVELWCYTVYTVCSSEYVSTAVNV